MPVRFAIDTLRQTLADQRVGIICTPAGWLPGMGALGDYLAADPAADVRAMFALEHGLRGDLQDGVHFDSYTDQRTGLPVFSYYGGDRTFPRETLAELDVVVFHAQDVSHRAYTYKHTLADTLRACAGTRTRVIVLDRPTPLGHLPCQGPLGLQFYPVELPVVTPFTLGELGLYLRRELALDVQLEVIPVLDYYRDMPWDETGLLWAPPSPNIPSLDSCYAYACTGMLQHTTISEARGTCKPFEYFGAPWVEPQRLLQALSEQHLPGVVFREVWFTPAFNKFAGELCGGIHLGFVGHRAVDAMRTALTIVRELRRLYPREFHPIKGFGRWLDGTEWTAETTDAMDLEAFLARANAAGAQFRESIRDLLLYA
jgi:uncharacterized protein YbbC (DUF1343 family)